MEKIINNVESRNITKDLWELATELGIECQGFDGSLVPNYIYYDAKKIEVNGQSAKYIICQERFQNSWQSKYTLILTDDIDKVCQYEEIFDKAS